MSKLIGNYHSGKAEKQGLIWTICGKSFDKPVHVKEALEAVKGNFMIDKCPLLVLTPDIKEKIRIGDITEEDLHNNTFTNRCATYRTDKNVPLGIVSPSYGIVQNSAAFEFIDLLCSGKDTDKDHTPVITNAGILGNGERVFITAKFPKSVILENQNNDNIDMYIVFTNSHDGLGAVTGLVTPIRVWCNNTLALAMKDNSGKVTFRHTANVMQHLDLMKEENRKFAYECLNIYGTYQTNFKEKFEKLKNLKLAEADLDRILAEVYLTNEENEIYKKTNNFEVPEISNSNRKIIYKIKDCTVSGVGQNEENNGTALALINGVTTYYQNYRNYNSKDSKFRSITEGKAKLNTQKIFDLVNKLQK